MQRKSHKRKRVQREGILTVDEGKQLTTLQELEARSNGERAKRRARIEDGAALSSTLQHCGRCNKPGHNACTCQKRAGSSND